MRQILAIFAVATVAGCASPPPAPSQVASATPTVVAAHQVCHKETVVGTNFAQTVCHTEGVDPNDPNTGNVTDDLSRQMGNNQAFIGRAGKG